MANSQRTQSTHGLKNEIMQEGKSDTPLHMTNFTRCSCYNCEMYDYKAGEEVSWNDRK